MINIIDVRICIYFTSSHHPTFPFYKSYLPHREHKAGTTESPGDAFYHDGKRPVLSRYFFQLAGCSQKRVAIGSGLRMKLYKGMSSMEAHR